MIYDISSVAQSLERISRHLDTSHDLENINKNLDYISYCLLMLSYIEYERFHASYSNLSNITFDDFLGIIKKCKS